MSNSNRANSEGDEPQTTAAYAFVTCQVGSEPTLKKQVSQSWPDSRFAYSRPGFITYKFASLPECEAFCAEPKNAFVRTAGVCLGNLKGEDGVALCQQAAELVAPYRVKHFHCFERDAKPTGSGFEPAITPMAETVAEHLLPALPDHQSVKVNHVASSGDLVIDCIIVDPNEWWLGYHSATTTTSRWPGGIPQLKLPEATISRAYLKLQEALKWSKMPIRRGDVCVEIGSSPGGASQALLDSGASVIGIDPAEMDERVLENPHFRHIRKRSKDVKKRELSGARWLVADCNVAPKYTLDAVQDIVTNRNCNFRGLLLTLKLTNWQLVDQFDAITQQVQSWGYRYVRIRQLAHNRQEVCLAALRSRAQRRKPGRPKKSSPAGDKEGG